MFDIRRYRDEELLELANLIAAVFFIDKTKDKSKEIIGRLQEVAVKLQGLSDEDTNVMWNWIMNIIARGLKSEVKKEIDDIFQKEGKVKNMVYALERAFRKEKMEARLQGKMEGKIEGKIEVIQEMLKEGDSLEKISRVIKLTIDEVKKIAETFVN